MPHPWKTCRLPFFFFCINPCPTLCDYMRICGYLPTYIHLHPNSSREQNQTHTHTYLSSAKCISIGPTDPWKVCFAALDFPLHFFLTLTQVPTYHIWSCKKVGEGKYYRRFGQIERNLQCKLDSSKK